MSFCIISGHVLHVCAFCSSVFIFSRMHVVCKIQWPDVHSSKIADRRCLAALYSLKKTQLRHRKPKWYARKLQVFEKCTYNTEGHESRSHDLIAKPSCEGRGKVFNSYQPMTLTNRTFMVLQINKTHSESLLASMFYSESHSSVR